MSIVDKNSVLILGAGVSVPFGLPLGGQLITLLKSQLILEVRAIDNKYRNYIEFAKEVNFNNSLQYRSFDKFPISSVICYNAFIHDQVTGITSASKAITELTGLITLLNDQTSETVDDFIVENPSYSNAMKIAISCLFFNRLYERINPEQFYTLKALLARTLPMPKVENPNHTVRNWTHLLINIVRQGLRNGNVSSGNKVQIISFNYDSVLEHVLDLQFGNTEKDYDNWREYIEVMHVHGKMDDLEGRAHRPFEICNSWAGVISVVNEYETPDELVELRKNARIIVTNATNIYACGFAFSGPNCRLLGLNEPIPEMPKRTISYANYDGNIGLRKAIQRFENLPFRQPTGINGGQMMAAPGTVETHIDEVTGGNGEGMQLHVHDWFYTGHVGELPA